MTVLVLEQMSRGCYRGVRFVRQKGQERRTIWPWGQLCNAFAHLLSFPELGALTNVNLENSVIGFASFSSKYS